MKAAVLLLLVFLVLTTPAFARLGETLDQLQARFGPPGPYPQNATVYSQGHAYVIGKIWNFKSADWSIGCTIINGICVQITYTKVGDMTDDQIATLLSNEAQGSKWSVVNDFGSVLDSVILPTFKPAKWKRDDGAYARKMGSQITFTTPDYDKAIAAAQQQGQAETQKMPANL
jgi:hypothetical protein